jgi:hypothetical protein
MRSAAGTPLRRLAIVLGAVAVALAITVPIALSSGSARGPVTNYVTYTGGKAGKANARLSPVVIGAINTQGGQVLVGPGWTNGIRTAVQYVNRYLGGVQGHPLVVSYCFTTSAEEEARSAARSSPTTSGSRSSSSVPSAVGNQSFYAALGNNKPTVGGVELLPVDAAAEERLRPLRDERLGARAVGHVRQERPASEDGCGRLHADPGNRLRARRSRRPASSRRGSRRRWSASLRTRPT